MARWGVRLTVVLAFVMASCGLTDNAADKEADRRARNAGIVMLRPPEAASANDAAWRVVGGPVDARATIEPLVADGTVRDGEIVLRISTMVQGGGYEGTTRAVRCYRYTLDFSIDDFIPTRVRCPSTPAIPLIEPVVRHLPPDATERLTAALTPLSFEDRSSVVAVKAAVVHAFPEPDVTIATAIAQDSVVGVALSADRECLAARLPRGAPPEVWSPPRVVVQPGELGCSADAFAQGLGKTPPH